MDALQGLFGYAVFIALVWAISESRRDIPWRTVHRINPHHFDEERDQPVFVSAFLPFLIEPLQ